MGTNSAMVQFCSRLFILLALGQAAVIETEDDICPCVLREECPRIFGSEPQDALLGSFSACRDPAAVRCCGVSTQINVEQSSSGLENGPVIPPDIHVPVPFQFPEYVDPRTTPAPPKYESYEDEYEIDDNGEDFEDPQLQAAVEKSTPVNTAKTLRGENIDGVVSQTSDHLDYRGVNDLGMARAVASAIEQSEQIASKISSSKVVESSSSSSSSSSDKKTETIVANRVQTTDAALPQILKEEYEDEDEDEEEVKTEQKSQSSRGPVRYTPSLNDPLQPNIVGNSIRGDVRYSDFQQQTSSEKVNKEASNFEENESSRIVATVDKDSEDYLRTQANRGNVVYGDRTQVSTQQRSESASKEAKSVEKSSSSNVGSVSLTTGQQLDGGFGQRRRRPVYAGQQKEVSSSSTSVSEQKSESVKKESSSFEEKATSSAASVDQESNRQVIESSRTPILEYRRPIYRGSRFGSRGQAAYGQRQQSSSQQKSKSVKQESSSIEESKSSNVESEALVETSPVTTARKPLYSRPRFGSRGQVAYGQRQESSSQQKSESVKKESSSSDVQSVSSNTEAQLGQEILQTSANPVPEVRRPLYSRPRIGLRGQAVYGQREESSSQQKTTESVKQESSSFEENKSSNVESVASNTEALLDHESKPETIEAVSSPVLIRRRPSRRRMKPGSSSETVYGQQQSTSAQQKTESVQKESSSFEENKSSSLQDVSSSNVASLDYGLRDKEVIGQKASTSSQQKTESVQKESSSFEENKSSVSQGVSLSDNVASLDYGSRNKQVIGQQQSTSSEQKSESVQKESSSFEENKSSNVQSATFNNAALLDLDSRDKQIYGQEQSTSSQQKTESVQKESSSFEENKSSNLQSVTSNNLALSNLGLTNQQVYGQQEAISSQQKTESSKSESSSFEENKSSSVQSSASNSAALLDHGSNSALLDASVTSASGTESTDQAVYAQQEMESSSQQKIESSQKESSSLEENKSSIVQVQGAAVNTDAILVDTAVHKEQESLSQQMSESTNSESSSVQESIASNLASISSGAQDLSHKEVSSAHLQTSLANAMASEHHEEATSAVEKSESSSVKKTTTNVASVDEAQYQASKAGLGAEIASTGSAVSQHAATSSQKKSEASSSLTQKTTSTSNLMNLITGRINSKVHSASTTDGSEKLSNHHEAVVTNSKFDSWHVAYLPIIINAGYLKDRPTSTGPVGLDPFTGVSLSDIMNPEIAPELLPLSCGNVIFGERFMAGKTVVCKIPKDNEPPFKFYGIGEGALSRGKLDGQVFSDNYKSSGARGLSINPAASIVSVSGSLASTNNRKQNTQSSSHVSLAESRRKHASETGAVVLQSALNLGANVLDHKSNYNKLESSVKMSSQMSSSETHSEEASKTEAVLSETENLRRPESTPSLTQNNNIEKIESSMKSSSQMSSSESHGEESSNSVSTVDAATNYRRRPLRTRFIVRRPVQVVPEEGTEAEEVILPAPAVQTRNRGQVRYSTLGEQLGSGQSATDSTSTSYSSSQEATSAQESVTSGSKTEITKSEFDVTSDDDYTAERNTEGKKSKFFVLPLAPVLPAAEPIKTVEVVEQNPKTRTRVSLKRSRNLFPIRKLPPNDLQVVSVKNSRDGAVQEETFIIPEGVYTEPSFAYQRRGRNVKVSNLAGNDATISPDDIASTGRVNVVGPIPSGYKDPAVFDEEEPILDLGLPLTNEKSTFRQRLETRSADYFKPSPVDPINWT